MYYKKFTSSTSWSCPKSGNYKIIAVGHGGSGANGKYGLSGKLAQYVGRLTAGSSYSVYIGNDRTSFGSLVSADCGGNTDVVTLGGDYVCGGEGGYTPDGIYGGAGAFYETTDDGVICISPCKNGGAAGQRGCGDGAGGSCSKKGDVLGHTDGSGGCVYVIEL